MFGGATVPNRQSKTYRACRLPSLVVLAVAWLVAITFPAAAQMARSTPNITALTVKTPRGGFNRMVVSVTVCAPGTQRCATIDDVMVDTGSTGLRIEASALPASLGLPPVLGPDAAPLGECLRFVHSAAWGPLVRADVRLGVLTARNIPIQVFDDGAQEQPDGCPRSDVRPTANGTLGIGVHLLDCQATCEQSATAPGVFELQAGSWVPLSGSVAPAFRVPNPVSRFQVHSNGIIIDLPAARPGGEKEVTGTLTFGLGTATDNRLEDARIIRLRRRRRS